MRSVRWDRASPDAFAAHPAWKRARTAVRERPAPEGSWDSPAFASRPNSALFVDGVAARRRATGSSPFVVLDVACDDPQARRAIIVVEQRGAQADVASLAAELSRDGVEQVWVSHPSDWCDAFSSLAWAPAGRDGRGHGVVVIDGVGVFRADQFTRALAKGDRRVRARAIVERLAGRVARLRDGRG
jgi:hypothetical protein